MLATKFERRVEDYVQQTLDRALAGGGPPDTSTLTKFGLAGLGLLLAFLAILVLIALLIKVAFF
jgi:hypothetical protein